MLQIDGSSLLELYRRRVAPSFQLWFAEAQRLVGPRCGDTPVFMLMESPIHGLAHWARVACYGLVIADHIPASRFASRAPSSRSAFDEEVLLAALFHDSGRQNEARDLGHAVAGRVIFETFAARHGGFAPEVVRDVAVAIASHSGCASVLPDAGGTTIALANADRLDRIRFGDPVDPLSMYDDGVWPELERVSSRFARDLDTTTVLRDVQGA